MARTRLLALSLLIAAATACADDKEARGVFEAGLPGAAGLLSIVAERGDDVALIRE